MRRSLSATTAFLLLATILFAHGNDQHIMGTVTNVTDTSITVKTQDGHSVDVFIAQDTKFMRAGQPISAKDVKQGDRIVIHARKSGEKLVATVVTTGKGSVNTPKGVAMPDDSKGAQPH